jgi:hypothetical protein
MQDLKKLGMTELIKLHNELAQQLGVATESSFKSLGAARTAITLLQQKAPKTMNTETMNISADEVMTINSDNPLGPDATPAGAVSINAPSSDPGKYDSTGKRGPNQGVGAFAKEQIIAGKSNSDALKAVLAKFPNAKTTTGCIAFYRTALTKGNGGADPAKLRADAQKLLDQAAAVEKARADKAAADLAAADALIAAAQAQAASNQTPA